MLQVHQLTKRFGDHVALDAVSFDLKAGETLAILGPSGSGKSTLLRCIQRLIAPDSGEIWFCGQPVSQLRGEELRAYRRRVGFVFQHPHLIEHMTVLENVALGPVMAGLSTNVALRLAAAALERVQLSDKARAYPASLSGGERQRAAIARTLALEPQLILWDEPTSALDPILVDEVLAIMAELASRRDRAMIVVTHEIPFALAVADRMALMERGKIVVQGEPEEVLVGSDAPISRKFRRLYEVRYAGLYHHIGTRRGRKEEARSRSEQRPAGAALLRRLAAGWRWKGTISG